MRLLFHDVEGRRKPFAKESMVCGSGENRKIKTF
jgi:hypothetical protein